MTRTEDEPPADRYGEDWAQIYDSEHALLVPSAAQLEMLAGLAGDGRALELGIGTGRLALPLAARGVDVQGVDASRSMVAQLRAKPGGDTVVVTIADMVDPPVVGPFRLVYVVFNTFFALLSQEAQVACFRNVAGLLEPGGAFVLECFVPDLGRFDRGQSLRAARVGDEVRLDASRHDPLTQQVVSSVIRIAMDGTSVHPVRLRYAWPPEMDLMAQLAGLRLRERRGGWDGQPFTAASAGHVSVYGRDEPVPPG